MLIWRCQPTNTNMNQTLQSIAQTIGSTLDFFGVLVILLGFLIASVIALRRLFLSRGQKGGPDEHNLYTEYRQSLARAILIGLEFLVAGDIIRTVSGDLTISGVATLGGIVLIRIVLGASLEAEIGTGKNTLFKRLTRQ